MITPRHENSKYPLYYEPIHIYPSFITLNQLNRVIVEIGPGRGDFLFHLAHENKDALIYGLEIKEKRFTKLKERRDAQKLTNIILVKSDARKALSELFADRKVDAIHINFPDPWPKRRHGHYRLINEEFLKSCLSVLKRGGELNFVTDEKVYAENAAKMFNSIKGFKSLYDPAISTSAPDVFETFFAKKWKSKGRTIYYLKYIKR